MSCFGCSKKYGLFCKEYGCPSCGYSYCAKCLKRPIAVPRHGGKVLNVCLICYDKLSKLEASEKVIDCEALPGTLVTKATAKGKPANDLVAAAAALLEDDPPADLGDVLAPISSQTVADATSHSDAANAEIEGNLDCVISKRLRDLKTVQNPSTDEEIHARLANLNGMPQKDYSKKDLLLSTDERTDQQKMHDLLEQFMGEAQLDQKVNTTRNDAISEIERRLMALRDTPLDGSAAAGGSGGPVHNITSPETNTPSDNEEDDETVLKSIMQKYLAEARLPAAPSALEQEFDSSMPLPTPGAKAADTEELPWCNICNEDAIYRCKGCDGELFCAQCYRECHDDDEEYRAHEKVPYSAPPKFKENHF